MKTFREEYLDLWSWRESLLKESSKLSRDFIGLDGSPRGQQERKDAAEYRRRLRELKAKHGVA